MSKTIDERVVSMQFDNRNFESNVKTTMSTLDKLKERLNLSGAFKGLDGINTAASKCNLSPIGNAVDGVSVKFSALQIAAVTALTNITNSAVNAGKQLLDSITVAPIREGFSEYEMTLNAIQTTMAGTGKTAAEVQDELKKLDEYADKTVYSTADMLNNLPKFTNAGVELEKATQAMIGIANATALAGGDAGKASIAFYNLGQAIGTGYLTRMDYNSINNAGIATMEWKNQMVEAAIAQGTLTKVGEDAYKAGNKTLTLQQLFIDGLQEQWATTDVMMKVFGDYGDETTEIGEKAYSAAQDIKTFSMMMDSLKATAGTGWKDTWQLLFGDLDQAKALWTGLSNFISNIITSVADFRNGILEVAMASPFAKLAEKVNSVAEPVAKITETLQNYEEIADRIIGGEFGNGRGRWTQLSEMGYDWAKAQNIVNERLGSSVRHTEELADAQGKQSKSQASTIEQLVKMSDAQLESLGFTKEEIKALNSLEEQSKKTGIPIGELAKDLDQLSGRNLLINSFKNIGKAIGEVVTTIKTAWQDIFPPKTIEERGAKIYDMIAAIHKFTTSLGGLVNENGKLTKTGDKLARTLKGVFAVIDIVATIFGGSLKIAFKVVSEILGHFNLNILDVTAFVGDALVKLRDMFDAIFSVKDAVAAIIPIIKAAVDGIKDWIASLKDSDNIGRDIVLGLIAGLGAGISLVWDAAMALGKAILDSIKSFLGIESPSREMMEVGKNVIDGLIIGLKNGVSKLWDSVKGIAAKFLNWFKSLDFGTIFAVSIGTISVGALIKLGKALSYLAAPLEGLGDLFENVGEGAKNALVNLGGMLKAKGKEFKANAWKKRAQAILSFALAIGVLAVALRVLADMDWETQTKPALNALAGLAVIVAALALVIGKFGPKDGVKLGNFAVAMLAMSVSILLIAKAVKSLADIQPDTLKTAGNAIAQIAVVMGVMALIAKIPTNAGKLGATMLALSISLMLMVGVVKLINKLTDDEITKAIDVIGSFIVFVGAVALANLISGKYVNKIGGTMIKMGIALALMVGVVKLINKLTDVEISNAIDVLWKYLIFVGVIAAISAIPGTAKIGGSLLGVTIALALMVGTVKLINKLTDDEITKAVDVLWKYLIFVAAVAAISAIPGTSKIAGTMIAMSVAIGILAGVVALVGLMDIDHINRGLHAVTILGLVFAAMILAAKGAQNCVGNLVVMTVAIAVMTACVAALTLIDPVKLAGPTLALALLMGMFALIAKSSSNIQGAWSSLIVMTVVVGLLAAVIYVLSGLPVESVIGSAAGLAVLLLSLSVSMSIVSKVGGLAGPAMLGMLAMVGIVALLAVVLGALTALDCAPSIETAAALSLMLVAMAGVFAILGLTGGLAGTAIAGAVGMMAVIAIIGGIALAIGGLMSLIPAEKVEEWKTGFENFMDFIVILATGLGEAIGGLIGGALSGVSSGITDIAGCLETLTGVLGPFAAAAKTIDAAALEGVKTLVEMITSISGASVMDAIASWITGSSSMDQFASSLKTFGDAIVGFSETVAGNINSDAIQAAGNAGQVMASLQAAIPEDKWLDGKISLDDFGKQIKKFGECITEYSNEVSDLDTSSLSSASIAATVLVSLAQRISNIDTDKLDDFKQIKKIGETISKYSNEVSGINSGAISASISAANRLITLVNSMAGIDISGVNSFRKAVNTLGNTNLNGFINTFSKATSELTSTGISLVDSISKGIQTGRSSLSPAANSLVTTLVSALRSKYATFQAVGRDTVLKFAAGINANRSKAVTAMKTVASKSASGAESAYTAMYVAGEYIGQGLIDGMYSKGDSVYYQGVLLGKAAKRGVDDGAGNASPSKLTFQSGKWVGEGLVNGINAMSNAVYKAGRSSGDTAVKSISNSISKISDVVNLDMDTQPVIRPVVDLSDVESGVGRISDLFAVGSAPSLMTNVGSINSMMNRRQNRSNSDVISAIADLGSKLGVRSGDTYNINGVNIGDDAEVVNAFKTIVKAAQIDRRR